MSNRLAGAASPYLAQHQDNPVDWWPWCPEAFAEATRRDVPVFLSIGYAACHWCHVMAHESFEDAATAELMNSRYVCIKVDREEHPEVDAVYMTAIQVQGEGGGWPLSAWCTADARPYFMGTYFPTTARHGRPSFAQVLTVMADAYRDKRDDVLDNVAALAEGLHAYDAHHRKGASGGDVSALNESLLISAGRTIVPRCDGKNGGLGGAPKFPNATALAALRIAARLPFGTAADDAATLWLRGMTEHGLYDQLGGGFARYCVDASWAVPHFEKMLYDNAQLLAACADGIAASKSDSERARLTEVIAETVGFFARELSDPGGGLWSSLDADSEGEEGKFYVWTPETIRAVLGPVDAMLFCNAYNVTDKGNFEHGTTVLARTTPRGSNSDEAALVAMRAKLLAARSARIRPGTDDKVLAGWNGLAISGLLAAWRVTGNSDAQAMAVRVGEFVVREMLRGSELSRMWKAGTSYHHGTLDDYAMVATAMLDLAEATSDVTWWQRGASLLTALRERFVGEVAGAAVFFLTTADGETLVHRPESNQDGATPSGASVAVAALLRLGLVAGDAEALALAERYLAERLGAGDPQAPITMPGLYVALAAYLQQQVVVISDGTGAAELATAVRRSGVPGLMLAGAWAQVSYLDGRGPTADGRAQAYVCRGATCQLPVSDAAVLTALLTAKA